MVWQCTVGSVALENRISSIAKAHPEASQDIMAVLDLMKNLFDTLSQVHVAAAQRQQAVEQAIEAETIAIVGAANYRNTFNRMTPQEFKRHLQQHFEAIGVAPPSWGEVAEIASESLLDPENDPDGRIRREIKNALINNKL